MSKYEGRKRKIRKWRKGMHRQNPDGSKSTHLMESAEWDGKHHVYPTLYPKKKKPSSKPKDWEEKKGEDAIREAEKRGEVVSFKSKKRAQKFAEGKWKKRKDRVKTK